MEILESLLPGKCVSFLILYLLQMIYHFAAIATFLTMYFWKPDICKTVNIMAVS